MDMKEYDEKRKSERVKIPGVKASFKLLDPRSWSSYLEKNITSVQNISFGGIALQTNNPLAVKSPIGIDIKLNSDHESIRTFGRVAWIKKDEAKVDNYNMGISFSWWKQEEDKKVVHDFIKKHTV